MQYFFAKYAVNEYYAKQLTENYFEPLIHIKTIKKKKVYALQNEEYSKQHSSNMVELNKNYRNKHSSYLTDFRLKSGLQSFFSAIDYTCPGAGVWLNYICQRIFKYLPSSYDVFVTKNECAKYHYKKYSEYKKCASKEAVYFEFGAGWDLSNTISMSTLGFDKLICIDIRKLMVPSLLNNTLSHMERLSPEFKNRCCERFSHNNWKRLLKEIFRIEYIAPLDASKTFFQDESIDFICTDFTLEHIGFESLHNIMKECYRILKKGGVMSHEIGYEDHWSYFDKNITVYNFLKYSSKAWKKYNPSIHFQNRLRHSDYINIFTKYGFKIVEEFKEQGTSEDLNFLKTFQIAEEFKHYDLGDLAVKSARFILRKE